MAIITNEDIRIELEQLEDERRENAVENAHDVLRAFHGYERKLYAVIAEDDVQYGTSGGIVGLYESPIAAARIAAAMQEAFPHVNWDETSYYVREFVVNSSPIQDDFPAFQFGWCYVE